jgi:hypothetical protein
MVAMAANHEKKIEDVANFNFALPPEVAVEFRKLGDLRGERNKLRWAYATAGILKLLEMPEDEREDFIDLLIGARRRPGKLQTIVNAAKTKGAPPDGVPLRGRLTVKPTRLPAKPAPR